MRLLTSSEMAAVDRETIQNLGIPGTVLMENAARGVATVIYKYVEGNSVLVVCGGGNNGGDGLAAARNLYNMGYDVEVVMLTQPEKLKGDAKLNYSILSKLPVPIYILKETELFEFGLKLRDFDIVVDAIFGTGLSRPVEGIYKQVIDLINRYAQKVVAVDIPSGLSGSTGEILGTCVIADYTVTFAYPKIVHVMPPACEYVGEVFIVDISIPEEATSVLDTDRFILTFEEVAFLLPPREIMSHKYTFGHLAVIGGSKGKTGAPSMVAEASLRTGTGLSTVIVPSSLNEIFEIKLTEAMSIPVEDENKGCFTASSVQTVLDVVESGKFSAVAIGPGLGNDPETFEFAREFIRQCSKPMVIDADGLNALAENPEILKSKENVIVTPHIGEFSRLTKLSKEEILSDLFGCAQDFAVEYGVTVVLKSGRTVIATPDGKLYLNVIGNPGMATAGTGDVLAGVIGGLLAMGLEAEDAAKLGVFLHSLSGDLAAQKLTQESLIATDLIKYLPEAIKFLKQKESSPAKNELPFVTSLRECVGV
ncbi:NAD(P)H-hydrate epimerase [Desulfurobacterium pacificum]|uniref:Bifunctional NAD(P)H-hydrate repair enzyme n=1 Tax=Desulfurobacterium pacificum TaxID=240166 RepID=A0ABY1NAS5_9BACT|nr:NAD(P)H-hydrate dehydratase [Desulfurobacterium pacificum]SMP03098.1 NAD(P)H-hydrate epimerase [Desulfurobacterium pacificum]